jgi:hypothetical protein
LEAQDVLDCGGALEVWSVELAQPVLAGCLFSPCKCGSWHRTHCAVNAPHGKHEKLAQV